MNQPPRNQIRVTPPVNQLRVRPSRRRTVHRRLPALPPAKDWRERVQRLFTRDGFERNRKWLVLLPVVPFVILTFLFYSVVIGFKSPQSMMVPVLASLTIATWCPGVWPGAAFRITVRSPKTSYSSVLVMIVRLVFSLS